MYKCRHFDIKELVSEQTYNKYGDRCWQFFDDRLLKFLDNLRAYFGCPIVVNTWSIGGSGWWGAERQYSGLRMPGDEYYSPTSQHTFGRAVDCLIQGFSAEQARGIIYANKEIFPELKSIETNVDWLHLDVRNVEPNSPMGLYLFQP